MEMRTLTFAQRLRAGRNHELTNRSHCARIALAAFVTALAGCGNAVSDSDIQFVTAAMPAQFEAFRMYGAVPFRDGSPGLSAHAPARLQQGCEAVVRSAKGSFRESVVLDSESAEYFELDVSRTPDGWTVTTDSLAAPSGNSVGLRTQFTNCLTAIKDKLRAQPERVQ
ncbi:hypothetical protein AB3X91_02400 [Paraburkholderia sp. BR14263]|uniref:Lipoprotein n=3 Tax=Burkholderiaceae TaxID=119060 RepID=A0ABU9RZA6_9BURK